MSTQICTESERLLDLLHGEVVVLGHLPPPAHLAGLVPLVVGNHGLVPANRNVKCRYFTPPNRADNGTPRNLEFGLIVTSRGRSVSSSRTPLWWHTSCCGSWQSSGSWPLKRGWHPRPRARLTATFNLENLVFNSIFRCGETCYLIVR